MQSTPFKIVGALAIKYLKQQNAFFQHISNCFKIIFMFYLTTTTCHCISMPDQHAWLHHFIVQEPALLYGSTSQSIIPLACLQEASSLISNH